MAFLDQARRYLKDRMTQDENIDGKPRDKIRDLSAALHHLSPTERKLNLEHVTAYVDYYYQGITKRRCRPKFVTNCGRSTGK